MRGLAAVVVIATACSHAAPNATPRRRVAGAETPPAAASAGAGANASASAGSLPQGPELDRELMAFVVLAGGAELARDLLPDAPDGPGDAQAHLFAAFGADPALARVIDLARPGAVAMLNPSLLASEKVRPYVAMLPVRSRAAVEGALSERGVAVERTPWGFAVASNLGTIYVGFARALAGDYALVAWRADLLDGTRRLLAPELARRAEAPVRVRVRVDNVYAAYGTQLDVVLAAFAHRVEREHDPQTAFALRGLGRLSRWAGSVDALELLASLDSGGVTLTARLDGKRAGPFADYVREQHPGPAWGLQFLPRDAVMVYTTHASTRGRADDVAASVDYLAGGRAESASRLKRALDRASAHAAGELSWAVWPGRAGGLGAGGAYRVSDAGAARAAVHAAYGEIAGSLGELIARALELDPGRWASRVAVHQRAARVAGVEDDLVEVTLKWPRDAQAERRSFEALFGPKLTLATAFVDDQALFALGADWNERLATMIGAAHGDKPASVGDEPEFAEALGFREHERVSMSYLQTERMARFASGLIAQVNELDPRQRAALGALLGQVGSGAIVSTTNAAAGRLELTTRIPRSAVFGAARLSGAMWRVALSPLVSPPVVPPMPVPPPNVTPSLTPLGTVPAL
jgi:hypothetical protein